MAIPFFCSGCNKTYKARDDMAGKSGKCPVCGQKISIPFASSKPSASTNPTSSPSIPQPSATHSCFGLEFVRVPPGQMTYLGRQISLTRPFEISKTALTFEHLNRVAEAAKIDVKTIFQKNLPEEKVARAYTFYSKHKTWAITRKCFNYAVAFMVPQVMTTIQHATGELSKDLVYRLPTDAEYAYASAGSKSLKFPWGNDWREGMIPSWDVDPESFAKLGHNVSWCGAFDLLSDARAWCLDFYHKETEEWAWKSVPTENPLVFGPPGYSHIAVVKGWCVNGNQYHAGNMWREFASGNETDWLSLRIVCGADVLNTPEAQGSSLFR